MRSGGDDDPGMGLGRLPTFDCKAYTLKGWQAWLWNGIVPVICYPLPYIWLIIEYH